MLINDVGISPIYFLVFSWREGVTGLRPTFAFHYVQGSVTYLLRNIFLVILIIAI